MDILPFVVDEKEAIAFYLNHPNLNDAQKAFLIGFLSREGFTNKRIREALGINKVYTVTHYKRVGTSLTENELILCSKNPGRITLGHMRAIAKLPAPQREKMLRGLLATKKSVHEFELMAQGKQLNNDVDIKRFTTRMSEVIGRPVDISFNHTKGKGKLVLDFYSIEDLDNLSSRLGYNSSEDF